jgi:UDP-glucose 4-epimerase
MKVLVAGGAGFIGTHTCAALIARGHEPVVLDNFMSTGPEGLNGLSRALGFRVKSIAADLRDRRELEAILRREAFDGTIHLASLKALRESLARPIEYYDNNVGGTLSLLAAMQDAGEQVLVFSSSAAVYGTGAIAPVKEDALLSPTNPYGRTKLAQEMLIQDACTSGELSSAIILRYFNPIGAHPGGFIGECPLGLAANVMPVVLDVASRRRAFLEVYGGDWPTRDGTCIRDYIHVMDVAEAHVDALEFGARERGACIANIGTGRGTTVLELVAAFERATGREVPLRIVDAREGDVAELWADTTRATALLGWSARYSIEQMCSDAWNWQRRRACESSERLP